MGNILSCLDDRARQQGDALLFAFHDGAGHETARYDYAGTAERSKRLAAHLRRHGLKRLQRTILLHPPGIELIVALLACCRLGAIPVVAPVSSPRGWRSPAVRGRIAAILGDCAPAVGLALQSQIAELADDAALGLSLMLLASDGPLEPAPAWCDEPGEIALLQYTSGSTSTPKGVIVTHHNIIANARALLDHAPVGVSWLPQFHDMGLIGFGLFPIVMGGRSHGFAPADFLRRPASWLRLLSTQRATFAAAPNFAYERALAPDSIDEEELADIDLSALRVMINGAEPVRPETCRRFRARFAAQGLHPDALVAAYGLAEATLAVTRGGRGSRTVDAHQIAIGKVESPRAADGPSVELASCGAPLPNLDIIIGTVGDRCHAGEVGEIHVRGPSITPGYWNRPARTAEEWLATGDLGFLWDGELYVTGRARELIIQAGRNFHPHDIEALLGNDPRGIAVQDDDGDVLLLCEPSRSTPPVDAAALADRIAASSGLLIDRVIQLPARSIRRTTSGKLARRRMLEELQAGLLRPVFDHRVTAGTSREARESALDWLRRRVKHAPELAGQSLESAGIDSLRLVQLQLEFQDMVAPDAGEAGDGLDGPQLQQACCGELLELADAFAGGHAARAHSAAARIASGAALGRAAEQERMSSDAAMPLARATPRPSVAGRSEAVLLTGATGFLGPFLLAELLEQSPLPITVLVRAEDRDMARHRVIAALDRAGLTHRAVAAGVAERLTVWPGDLTRPALGLDPVQLQGIAGTRYDIVHNGAMVDYVRTYDALRPANVCGTRSLLDLAARGAPKRFHHVSSTFVFGWTRAGVLRETDCNETMEALDFGYSQTKWVAETLVRRAGAQGLPVAVYRPSLISVGAGLQGDSHDVAARLLAFMIRHGVAVDTPNQVSLLPVDVVARNLVAISQRPIRTTASLHLTADRYYSLTELVRQIERDFGFRFHYLPILPFVARLNALATPDEPVFPLLDFFNRSAPHIAAMSLKRYDSTAYRSARATIPGTLPDPSLEVIAGRMVGFLERQGWLSDTPSRPAEPMAASR
ncbi:thioester reductase domain-containing protein [Sphingomonas sp. QA11]|uniref:thioester reductase domain-containing protein n=1 Tax=Sphingomonas sp. QA11 TaxID=2950605 RepID=UPI00300DF731